MQVNEIARKHGVSVQKVLTLLEEGGVGGKDPASSLTEAEMRQVEKRLATAKRATPLVASGVKVLRPGVTGPAAPIIRKPTTPAASSVSRPAAKPSTGTAAKPKAAKPKEEKETPGEERDFRRTGTESKARDLLRTKRLRESGIKPKSAVEPPPAPTPATEMEEPQPPAMEAAPTPEPPRAVEETPTPPPTPISQARSAPVQTPDSRPARRPSQASGGQQGHQGQRPRRGDQGQQQRKGPRSGETRSQQRAALETAPPPAATPATPPPAAASDAKGKKGKGKKERPVEEVEVRKDRDSSVSERKVLASIMGRKKGKKQQYKRAKKERFAAAEEAVREREQKERTTLRIHEATTVADVAHGLGVNPSAILKILLDLGKILTVNQHLDRECIDLIAEEFGFDVEETSLMEINPFEELEQEDRPEDLRPRPPVVTVMGHVDHGKTKLMDAIRSADVASGEAGGITQHLGAYFVQLDSGPITFIDTPGHEAFTAMRARGAMVTDVVVLVVAADDGVMPQTREAISHARAAGVPILVAINKIDVQGANVDRVKQQLAAEGLVPEDWGGTTPVAEISALRKQGIGQLVELIHLQAELLELKANPDKCAKGTVLEARLEQGRGVIVTALVQEGTLRVGDPIVAGVYAGKVRALLNEHTLRVEEAVPGVPVAILGLSGAPVAGDEVRGVPDEKTARELSGKLQQIRREREMIRRGPVSLESLFSRIEEGSVKDLNVIIKGDVQGSVEAVCESLQGIESEKVRVRILHRGVGAVSESDVMLASASDALILGFNVVVPAEVAALQQREKVDIRIYRIIYDAIEDIKKAMMGLLADEVHEIVVGHFEVMQIFRSSKAGLIIGGQVSDGKIIRGRNVRVLRDGKVIHEGKLSTLRRFKDEVNEVPSGLECGVGIEGLQDIRERDVLECYQMETVAATL